MTTVKFSTEVGRLTAGRVKRMIGEYLFKHADTFHIEEMKGFPTSLLLIEFTAEDSKAQRIAEGILKWATK